MYECLIIKIVCKWPLESMEAQGMHRDLTKKERKWNGKRREEERIRKSELNWAAVLSRSDGSHLSANQHAHFGQPTTNRVELGSASKSVFGDSESSISCLPTNKHNLGQPTANRVQFGSISRMVNLLLAGTSRSDVGQLAAIRQTPSRLADR